jgi:hypothetical protein
MLENCGVPLMTAALLLLGRCKCQVDHLSIAFSLPTLWHAFFFCATSVTMMAVLPHKTCFFEESDVQDDSVFAPFPSSELSNRPASIYSQSTSVPDEGEVVTASQLQIREKVTKRSLHHPVSFNPDFSVSPSFADGAASDQGPASPPLQEGRELERALKGGLAKSPLLSGGFGLGLRYFSAATESSTLMEHQVGCVAPYAFPYFALSHYFGTVPCRKVRTAMQ